MVFIAYNHKNKIVGIVSAKSRELAVAFWQGDGVLPNTIKCVEDPQDFSPLEDHPTGVYPLMRTKEASKYDFQDRDTIIIQRSL